MSEPNERDNEIAERMCGSFVDDAREIAAYREELEARTCEACQFYEGCEHQFLHKPASARSREDEALGGLIESWQRFADEAPSSYALVAARVRDKFIPELRAALRSRQSPPPADEALLADVQFLLDASDDLLSTIDSGSKRRLVERLQGALAAAAPQPSPQGEDALPCIADRPMLDDEECANIVALFASSPAPEAPKEEHGKTCRKEQHVGEGYLHGEDDDTPYYVDNVEYCGRCHTAI